MWMSTTTNIGGTNVQKDPAGGGGRFSELFLLP